jgi:very-short-patch-repair endonuclease
MGNQGESKIWAIRDRARVPPQRQLARQMRAAPTQAERKLWWHLRHQLAISGTHFRRQVQIGRFIVDFACHSQRVIIEVDGAQHGVTAVADAGRTRILEANGYRVLRYWNNDVLCNINGVLEDIRSVIAATPTPSPSPQGGGERAETVAQSCQTTHAAETDNRPRSHKRDNA